MDIFVLDKGLFCPYHCSRSHQQTEREMGENDSFRIIPEDAASLLLVLLALVGFLFSGHSMAGDIRAEAGLGKCQHQLAPDASWHYDYGGYQNNITLAPYCGQIGVLWNLDKTFGLRLSYVDLGTVDADNTYPIDEPAYFKAKDSHTAVVSDTGRFQGFGNAKGVTFGPVVQKQLLGLNLSAEAGAALLYNEWHVDEMHWNYADGWNTTWYAGVGARWKALFVSVRRYQNVHASQASENPLFVGMTSGPVWQTIIGVSFPL